MSYDTLDLRDLATELVGLSDRDNLNDNETERKAELEALEGQLGQTLSAAGEEEPCMVSVDGFDEYAEELAGDIGAIDPKASWPLTYIDWEAAADELAQDYSEVEFDGRSWYRRDV